MTELDLDFDTNPKQRATLHSILVGSVRPNARLAKSHGIKPHCRCGAEKEDVQHLFGNCPDHAHIRQKYGQLIQQVAWQDGETKDQILPIWESQTFLNCGIIQESEQLIRWHDLKDDKECDAAEVPPLAQLTAQGREDELCFEDWLRIFTDGGVADPDDYRIALGGRGIYFGHMHPLNTSAQVTGRQLDSYRAELQAVGLVLSRCRSWGTKIWITLDNSAVVGDLNKRIQNQGKIQKQDNKDIWDCIAARIKERAARAAIRVTWTKGHVKEEHITRGQTDAVELARNRAADKLATAGIAMNDVDGIMLKAARQRKLIAAIQQTMLVKMWLNRQELQALDEQEQKAIDDEAEAIAEMEGLFNQQQHPPQQSADTEFETTNLDAVQDSRKPWRYVKAKVPTYKWDASGGDIFLELKPDWMPSSLRDGQKSWWYDLDSGGRNRIRIDFPLHLWVEIGPCWSQVRWRDRSPGLLRGVTWLELLVDFELLSGINCMRPQSTATWGARAELLRGIVKLVLKVRGPGATALDILRHIEKSDVLRSLRGAAPQRAPAPPGIRGWRCHRKSRCSQCLTMGRRRKGG